MRSVASLLLSLAIPALVLVHLYVAPYTKVEESFHIQAIHDILTYGIPFREAAYRLRRQYDHFTFPGAVPRSFLGALVLSGLSEPLIWLYQDVDRQMLARAILGLANAGALLFYATGVRRTFGWTTGKWYLLFQASQFHVIFYASRTLSNMFAFVFTTVAMRYTLPEPTLSTRAYKKRCVIALCLLTLAGIIFRSELALLLAATTVFLFSTGRIGIQHEIFPAGLLGLLVGLASTVTVDSYFWQQFPLWPELSAFRFNVLAGQASAWGIHPWHFYFTNAIPRLLLNPLTYLLCIPFSVWNASTRASALFLLTPALAFLAMYSFQPHKEWRFIVYIEPPLTAAAALGASYIWTHQTKSIVSRTTSLMLVISTLATFCLSNFVLLPASAANYPGAHALRALQSHVQNTQSEVSVYLGNLACQTGVTRFLEHPITTPALSKRLSPGTLNPSTDSSTWRYDKTEDNVVKSTAAFWRNFDYALVEPDHEERRVIAASADPDRWSEVRTVGGFTGLRVLRPGADASGDVERDIARRALGDKGAEMWDAGRDFARRHLTRGWWVELKMEPKIKILKHHR